MALPTRCGTRVTTTVSDLYAGQTFADLDARVNHAQQVWFDTIIGRGVRAAEALPNNLAYLGFSLGVMPAQKLAQTRLPKLRFICQWAQFCGARQEN